MRAMYNGWASIDNDLYKEEPICIYPNPLYIARTLEIYI